MRQKLAAGTKMIPAWYFKKKDNEDIFNLKGKEPEQTLLLDKPDYPGINDTNFPEAFGGNFYRSDDVSATAYFYLDKPTNNPPGLSDASLRIKNMMPMVLSKTDKK
jgi:hypothetical protein